MVRSLLHVVLFAAAVALAACSGDAGPEGPAGPQGPTGDPGTANVSYSDWFQPSSWTNTVLFGINTITHDEAAAGITQEILDTGVVLVFGKLNGYAPALWPTDQVSPIPLSVTYDNGGGPQRDVWSAFLTVGNVQVHFTNDRNTYSSLSTSHEFRYVIIPAGAMASPSYAGTPVTDWSYEEAVERFDIPARGARL